ncbi:phage tail protein [Pseudomonas sp.]|uniref:phage tail protein n=1 Tax=Pseudomonas sp. TaxID=306 RepID=UPI003FD76684
MTDTFTWLPDKAVPGKLTQRARSAQFGSGYEQSAGDGLNTETQSWDLTFTGQKARIIEIRNFLRSKQGYKSFLWSSPLDGLLSFKCTAYNPSALGGNVWSLTATFNQSFQVT